MQEIMILGTFHFRSLGNRDKFKLEADILSPERQQEVLELVDALERFRPTKIAVEDTADYSDALQESYQAYLSGKAELTVSEMEQIGFRLAKRLGHEQLWCVDWNEAVPGVGSVFQWMMENPSEHVEELDRAGAESNAREQEHLESSTLREHFIYMNDPQRAAENHRTYLEYAKLDDGPWPVGTGWVGQYWYYRNLRIWKNATALFQQPDERVLLLIGGGHLHLLSQFFREAGQVKLVDAAEFLRDN